MWLGGFSARIVRGQGSWERYEEIDEKQDFNVMSCFIECRAGEHFAIEWQDERQTDGNDGARGIVQVDGQFVAKRDTYGGDVRRAHVWGAQGNGGKYPIKFNHVNTSLAPADRISEAESDINVINGIGSIELTITRAHVRTRQGMGPTGPKRRDDARYFKQICEQSKPPGVTNAAGFGDLVPEDPDEHDRRIMFASRAQHELCNLETGTYVTFRWHYRDRAYFEASDVASRRASVTPRASTPSGSRLGTPSNFSGSVSREATPLDYRPGGSRGRSTASATPSGPRLSDKIDVVEILDSDDSDDDGDDTRSTHTTGSVRTQTTLMSRATWPLVKHKRTAREAHIDGEEIDPEADLQRHMSRPPPSESNATGMAPPAKRRAPASQYPDLQQVQRRRDAMRGSVYTGDQDEY